MLNQNMSYQKYAVDHRILIVFQENRKESFMSNSWPFLYPSQSISDKIMQIVKKKPRILSPEITVPSETTTTN